MKHFAIFFFSSILLVAGACKTDKEGSLTVHFLGRFEGQPLTMFDTQNLMDEGDLQFTHLSMLISDIALLSPSGPRPLSDIELVDLSFDDVPSASEGYTIRIDGIPSGTYTGISFGIGVPPDVNNQKPSEFPSTNPLSRNGFYWEAWNSYIFMKTEGKMDTGGPGPFETNFAYHTGTDELFRTLEGSIPLTIADGQTTDLNISFDYAEILKSVNISEFPQNHNPEDSVQIAQIVNNLQSSISLFQ